MPSQQDTQEVITSALSLSTDDRLAVMDAIHVSLADSSVDHGPAEVAEAVQAAWQDEIARRIGEIDSDSVKTVPAQEAERMIKGDAKPAV